MKKYNPFDLLAKEYEAWFVENKILFQSELLALKKLVPTSKKGIEIGIGSGIFAEQLGIRYGVDPSEKMLGYARNRGLQVQTGVAENLPYDDASFDFAVFITTICFVDDPERSLQEAYRVLKNKGEIIIAILDRETPYGSTLEKAKEKNVFYKNARFFSTPEIVNLLEKYSFKISRILQTLENLASTVVEYPSEGFGMGSFVVVKGVKEEP